MVCGLVGENPKHSLSPWIHARLGSYEYRLFPLRPAELEPFMRARRFDGVNVTIPYKRAVLNHCDHVDPRARQIGAANTIVNSGGHLTAYNTDYDGLLYLFRHAGMSLAGKHVMILGSGGTARAAHLAAQHLKAASIVLVSRGPAEGAISYSQAAGRTGTDVIINTTPVGAFPHHGAAPIHLPPFSGLQMVVDVAYNPLKTALLLQAQRQGCQTANGLGMLVAQAKAAAEHFTATQLDDGAVEKIHRELLWQRLNLVLIGMPGVGKSAIGRRLAQALGRPLEDLDTIAAAAEGCPIEEIFAQKGESYFRDLESRIAAEAGEKTGMVISTGGGTVLCPENVDALRQNGLLVYLSRPVGRLHLAPGRPLARSRQDLQNLFRRRAPIYAAAADITCALGEDDAQAMQCVLAAAQACVDRQFRAAP